MSPSTIRAACLAAAEARPRISIGDVPANWSQWRTELTAVQRRDLIESELDALVAADALIYDVHGDRAAPWPHRDRATAFTRARAAAAAREREDAARRAKAAAEGALPWMRIDR